MRLLAILAVLCVAAPLGACGSTTHETVVAQPGSTVVAPAGAKVEHAD